VREAAKRFEAAVERHREKIAQLPDDVWFHDLSVRDLYLSGIIDGLEA
jgi:hypothetical protein